MKLEAFNHFTRNSQVAVYSTNHQFKSENYSLPKIPPSQDPRFARFLVGPQINFSSLPSPPLHIHLD